MWFLIGQENVEQIACWISLDKPVTIGRKGCTLVVSNDQSISRHHITLWAVRNNEVGALTPSSVYIRDEKARYGTYVNKQIVQEGEQRLNDKDEIQLGSQTSRFRICYRPVNICYSKVPSGTQKQLTQLARSMDITTTNQWHNECTHLLMEELCVTDKVVLALIHGIPIVTSGWLRALASAHDMLIEQGEKSLPDPNLFLPRITDPSIPSHISFRANPRRRNLFANRVFITFSEEQYVRVDRAISAAGGKAVYCRIGEQVAPTAIAIAEYCRAWTSVCILEPCQIDLLEVVRRAASRLDRPLTPECDIGLAVMYGSTSIYCSDDSMTSSTLSSEHNTETNSLASSTSQLTEKGITETKKCVQPTLNEAFKFARARTGSELSSKFNSLLENMMSSESATESSISSSLAKIPAMNDVILSTMEESDISVRNTSASVIEQERSSKLTSKAVVDSMPYPMKSESTTSKTFIATFEKTTSVTVATNNARSTTSNRTKSSNTRTFKKTAADADLQLLEQESERNEPISLLDTAHLAGLTRVETLSLVKTASIQSTSVDVPVIPSNQNVNYKRFKKTSATPSTVIPLVEHTIKLGTGAPESWLKTTVSAKTDCEDIFIQHHAKKVNRERQRR